MDAELLVGDFDVMFSNLGIKLLQSHAPASLRISMVTYFRTWNTLWTASRSKSWYDFTWSLPWIQVCFHLSFFRLKEYHSALDKVFLVKWNTVILLETFSFRFRMSWISLFCAQNILFWSFCKYFLPLFILSTWTGSKTAGHLHQNTPFEKRPNYR